VDKLTREIKELNNIKRNSKNSHGKKMKNSMNKFDIPMTMNEKRILG